MEHKKAFKLIMFLIILLVLLPFHSHAQVPGQINFQGQLLDMGSPASGFYNIEFALYDTATGESPLWNELQSVEVTEGIYNVILGQPGNELTADLFSTLLYLGVKVGDDDEMIPRQILTSVPFAIQAGGTSAGAVTSVMLANDAVTTDKVAPDAITADKILGGAGSGVDADKLDGMDAASFSQSAHNHDTSYYSKVHVDALEARIASLEAKLQHLTVVAGTINGMVGPHVMITGANFHVRNGLGQTNSTNQTGNLIVGYNEPRGTGNERSGSHNIVVGQRHNYTSYGGLVAGYNNAVSDTYSTVNGGSYNIAAGAVSSISGGSYNTSSGDASSVIGGVFNTASGYASSISGGRYNKASGDYSFVGGGGGPNAYEGNIAFADYSSILGGSANGTGDVIRYYNDTDYYYYLVQGSDHSIGIQSSVSSGNANIASGDNSSVSGGKANIASDDFTSVSGGFLNNASREGSSVSGGDNNTASGVLSSVSSGWYNEASNMNSSVIGGVDNTASGPFSSVSGGYNNTASGGYSSISGGDNNTASGNYCSISGGRSNKAIGDYSFIGGGGHPTNPDNGNVANADYSAILGGAANVTGNKSNGEIGRASCISGGFGNFSTEIYTSVAGGRNNQATGQFSSVSGGGYNIASGENSSVSGGSGKNADTTNEWWGGDYHTP